MSKIRDLFGKIVKPEIEVFVEQTKKSSPFIYTKVNEEYTNLLIRMINEKTEVKLSKVVWNNGFRNFANSCNFEQTKNILKNNDLLKSLPFRISIIEVKAQ
jgi:hypothetical protein